MPSDVDEGAAGEGVALARAAERFSAVSPPAGTIAKGGSGIEISPPCSDCAAGLEDAEAAGTGVAAGDGVSAGVASLDGDGAGVGVCGGAGDAA